MKIVLIIQICVVFAISNDCWMGDLRLSNCVEPALELLQVPEPVTDAIGGEDLRPTALTKPSFGHAIEGWPISLGSNAVIGFHQDQPNRKPPPLSLPKFDEYGDLSFTKEKERLNYFAKELTAVSGEPGYIIEYRSKRQRQRPLARAKLAKEYLVRVKGIDAKRIIVVNGGYQKEFKIELRLGPIDAK